MNFALIFMQITKVKLKVVSYVLFVFEILRLMKDSFNFQKLL